jgi:hypothetical protein
MSRSRKKPYVSFVCIGRGSMKKWKAQCNDKIRHKPIDDENEDLGKIYKKVTNRWTAPDDGKTYWDEPKARRK